MQHVFLKISNFQQFRHQFFPNSTDSGPSMKIHVVGKPQKIRNNNGIKKKGK